jgi:Protein of unknown function (DUF2855)
MPTPTATQQEFRVRRDDLRNTQIVTRNDTASAPLQSGEVLLKIDRFALTSNNITYAAFGDSMKYWDFYPSSDGWGIIPVWGFADVVASAADGVTTGERFYGYYPMASHVTLKVARTTAAGFIEGTELRRSLAAVYNTYVRTATDPTYDKARECEQALLKPLYLTSWLISDLLSDNAFFGANSVILSSASSKTSYGTAHALKQLPAPRPTVIGLTSERNKAFTQSLRCYDEVRTYDEIPVLPTAVKTVYVDMSGDTGVRAALHTRFGNQLTYSCSVGGTHWEHLGSAGALPGPRPAFFFAPAQIKKRATEWGPAELQNRMNQAFAAFLPQLAGWMQVIEARGPDAIKQTYLAVLDGKAGPNEGHMLGF